MIKKIKTSYKKHFFKTCPGTLQSDTMSANVQLLNIYKCIKGWNAMKYSQVINHVSTK